MKCEKCKTSVEKESNFCPNCGKKVEAFEIKKDIGEETIKKLEKLLAIIEKKKKEEAEKPYPCPHCNKEITIQSLIMQTKLNIEGSESPSIPTFVQ